MHLRAYKCIKKKEKEVKNCVGWCWIKFGLDQTFRPIFSISSNQIFMLDAFGYSFIQHLAFHYCVECKAYAVECVSNVFINIWMSIVCGVPQKIKRRKGCKPDKREEAKMASKTEKGSNAKKTGPMMRFSCLLTCSKQALAYGTCITPIIPILA